MNFDLNSRFEKRKPRHWAPLCSRSALEPGDPADVLLPRVLVAGVGVGRLRLHHQPDPSARVCAAANAALQPESLHR